MGASTGMTAGTGTGMTAGTGTGVGTGMTAGTGTTERRPVSGAMSPSGKMKKEKENKKSVNAPGSFR